MKLTQLRQLIKEELTKSRLKENYNKPGEEHAVMYWENMIEGQPEDVLEILVSLTTGKLNYDEFERNTWDDIYDSFKDELYDED